MSDNERNAYRIEQYYHPTRFHVSQEIERKVYNYFMVPSQEYRVLDEVVKRGVKSLMHSDEDKFYEDPNKNSKTTKPTK